MLIDLKIIRIMSHIKNGESEMKSRILFTAAALIIFLGFSNVNAQENSDQVIIHGFGAWGAGITDGNEYLGSTEDGDYDILRYALNISSNPYENLRLNGQFEMHGEEGETELEIDFAFAEWAFSDQLKFRIGRVKHPFGIYAEIYDIGTVRPFFELPQGIYGPVEAVAEGYQGLGFSGSTFSEGGWGISYDIYGGELNLETEEPWEEEEGAEEEAEEEEEESAIVFGGRLIIDPGVEGFSFGFSGYYGKTENEEEAEEEEAGEEESEDSERYVLGLQAEYDYDKINIRSEYVMKEDLNEDESMNSAYVEASYKLTEHWQAAVLYDYSKTNIDDLEDEESSILEHTDIAFGLNYWFNTNFVLKLSYHMVDGNRFAVSDEDEKKTTMISFGSQYSF